MKEISLERILEIQKELKEANKLLDNYFKKEMKRERDEKLKGFTSGERSAYSSGLLDGAMGTNPLY